MATEPDLRREIADERRELTNAVSDLRKELDHTAERGKQIGVMVGAAAGALLALRTALKIRRRHHGD
jgi:surfactin synthase thioesterase subunit